MVKTSVFLCFIFHWSLLLLAQGKAIKFVVKGNEYLASLNYEKAEYYYNRALLIDSNCVEAYIQKSDIKVQKNEFKQALILIERAKQVAEFANEKNELIAHIYSFRSFIFFNQSNYQNAIEDLNKAISLNDQNASFYFMRALIKRMKSDLKGCCSDLKKASSLGLEKAKDSLSLYCK
jgi:tetratricopeptide (TPR) repeat protein